MNYSICEDGAKKIYALIDPRDNLIKYVGCSKQPDKRVKEHMSHLYDKGAKVEWIKGLKRQGFAPRVFVLGEYADNEAKWQEREWFYFFLSMGYPMLNDPARLYGGTLRIEAKDTELPFEQGVIVYRWRNDYRARVHRQAFCIA